MFAPPNKPKALDLFCGAGGAMGVDWKVTRRELSESIPPLYGEHIGRAALAHINRSRKFRDARHISLR